MFSQGEFKAIRQRSKIICTFIVGLSVGVSNTSISNYHTHKLKVVFYKRVQIPSVEFPVRLYSSHKNIPIYIPI